MDDAVAQEIAELLREEDGFNIKSANRSGGSIRRGIALLEDYELYIVIHNAWMEEQEKYVWVKTKGGIYEKVPTNKWNHCWDATRYMALEVLAEAELGDFDEEVVG
jgi:hypothetical protein